ncbi:MAG: hypothetical protein LLG06_01370 [Desulfobacteraceae bacterium]|nr:hypothetical protein [Desulfobacteraceae bacterium]
MELTKEEFAAIFHEIREVLASDEHAECSCPNTKCPLHGDCYNCIRAYRHFGRNIPRCMHFILEQKIGEIVRAAESAMLKRPRVPEHYYDGLEMIVPKKI